MSHDTFATPPLEFAPPAGDSAERALQAALTPLLREHSDVTQACLARVSYDDRDGGLVLGLVTSADDNEELVDEIGKLFASLFDASLHLDIIFVSDEQRAAIQKVTAPFYVRRSKAFRLVASLFRLVVLVLFIQPVIALLAADPAHACACCSERGTRVDRSVLLDEPTRLQIGRMAFATETSVNGVGDAGPSPLRIGASSSYLLTVTRNKQLVTFSFKDTLGRASRLSFVMPQRVWMFAVDPFGDAKDEGLGPLLYKEWRLTAPVKGDGIFRTPFGQTATLIFHGRGRGCTEAEHFSDWSLLLHGPAGKATFYGKLDAPP